jgi:hypothetical protein
MKTIMALILAAFLPTSAFAWWPAQPNFIVNQNFVQATVYNPTPFWIYCQGYAFGQTQMGQPLNTWFAAQIPPGGAAYANVYAYYPYFFVNAWADIRCQ